MAAAHDHSRLAHGRTQPAEGAPYPYASATGRLAQLGEHLPYKQGVGGSSPSPPTRESLSTIAFHGRIGVHRDRCEPDAGQLRGNSLATDDRRSGPFVGVDRMSNRLLVSLDEVGARHGLLLAGCPDDGLRCLSWLAPQLFDEVAVRVEGHRR
jgi:hypothetical protein